MQDTRRILLQTKFIFLTLVLAASLGAGCGGKKIRFSQANGSASNESDKPSLVARIISIKIKKNRIDLEVNITNKYKHPVYLAKDSVKLSFNGNEGIPKGPSFVRRLVRKSVTKETAFLSELAVSDFENERLSYQFFPEIEKNGTGILSIQPIFAEAEQKPAQSSESEDKPKAKPKKSSLRTRKDDRTQNLDKPDTNGDLIELPPLKLEFTAE